MKTNMVVLCAVLACGCFGSGGSGGGSGGTSAGGSNGGAQGTGGTGAQASGGTGMAGSTSVGTAGGAGTSGTAGTSGAAGAGGSCCPCPDRPQPAGCLECDLFCPNDSGGGPGLPCSASANPCPSNMDCCIEPGGNYCVAKGTCIPSKCASPDTPIATPEGSRPIAELREGDLVLSVDHGAVVAVPIVATRRVAVSGHAVAHIELDDGRALEMSAGHPTADGRTLGALAPGDALGDAHVASVSMIPYTHAFTYDILPASDTGAYFAAGALVGSTLAGGRAGGMVR